MTASHHSAAAAIGPAGFAVAAPAAAKPAGPDAAAICYVPGRIATAVAVSLSSYFFIACFSLYWLTYAAAALGSLLIPRAAIARATPLWLAGSVGLVAWASQSITGFFPDYGNRAEIGAEVGMWLALGLAVRSYLTLTALPDTFDGLRASIAERVADRWFAAVLLRPLDAIFTRIAIANTMVLAPLTLLLVLPQTCNYLVLAAWGTIALLIQFPQDLMDHANIHNRIFTPRGDAPARSVRVLRACQRYYENALCLMALQIPDYYRIQHNYVHHVEDNGPADSQTTLPYDRTSFIDFARHALVQGIDLVTGRQVFGYLAARNKTKQAAELRRAITIWYSFLAVVAVINPLAAVAIFASRYDAAIAAGIVMINIAERFLSSDLNKANRATAPQWSTHPQPKSVDITLAKVKQLPRRSATGVAGYDALGIVVVDCVNDGSPVRLHGKAPAPQVQDNYHYATLINRLQVLYDTRFAQI